MKSNVSGYLELVQAVYLDACAKCTADVSDLRDLMTIKSRTEQEGMSFLTITLPQFAKDFERSLADGFVDPSAFRSFRKARAIPAFLQGMLGQLFCQESGRILDYVPDHSTIVEAVRQICLCFKKIEMQCAPQRQYAAIENFVQVEQDNNAFSLGPDLRDVFLDVSDCLWHNALSDISSDMLIPRHGPGATAERISGNQKYVWRKWYQRLDDYFPFFGNAYTLGATEDREEVVRQVTFVPEDEEEPVRVHLVPKTLKSPRIIAIEPACMQYAQQAVQRVLYERIERCWLTRGHVNFTDQSINQRLAVKASRTGRYSTIDLSDASDRVLYELAIEMFRSNPFLREAVGACRSRFAKLPGGRLVGPLSKFASMGNALTFPVESMYFYTICVVALLKEEHLPVNPRNIFKVSRRIFVYGDDLVVPTDKAVAVLDYLQKYNCKVNSSKTFYTGKFRESCGVDAYAGEPVTPTYVRQSIPENRQQATELISWSATANLFYLKGYWRTASLMFAQCERILRVYPYVSVDSPALGRISYLGFVSANNWDEDTQSLKQRAWVPRSVYRSDEIGGYSALSKCLSRLEEQTPSVAGGPSEYLRFDGKHLRPVDIAEDHLERSARYGAVALTLRGVPATLGRGLGS